MIMIKTSTKKLTLSQNDSADEYSGKSELGLAWQYRKGAGIDSSIKWGPTMQSKGTTFSSDFKIPKMIAWPENEAAVSQWAT
jgi:hypothetical protein